MTVPDASPLTESERTTILLGVLLAIFLGSLVPSIVAPALPTMGAQLGDVDLLPWVITAYYMTATAVTPLYGKLSDIYGRRSMLYTSLAILLFGSVLCAFAPSIPLLAVARAIQGLGGGGLIALGQAAIGDVFPPRDRGRYQGWISITFAASSLGSPILGGLFAEFGHWSLIFWFNVPIGLAAFLIMHRALKRLPQHHRHHRLDLLGAALLTAATLTLLFALSWGGVRYPWISPQIVGLLLLTAILIGWLARHLLHVSEPLLPIPVLSNRVIAPLLAASFFTMVAYLGVTAYLPIYFEYVLGLTPGQAGAALIGPLLGSTLGGAVMGTLISHSDSLKFWCGLSLLGSTLAMGALIFTGAENLIVLEALLTIGGFGIGMLFPISTVATQNAVERHHMGVATGVLNFIRTVGAGVGAALFGAILVGSTGAGGLQALRHGGASTALNAVAAAEISAAFTVLFALSAAGFALGLVSLLLTEYRPMRATI